MVMGYVLYTSTPQVRFLPPVLDSGIARRGKKRQTPQADCPLFNKIAERKHGGGAIWKENPTEN